jgi:hypothetical protein
MTTDPKIYRKEVAQSVIPDAAWPDLLGGRRSAAAETLLNLLAGATRALPSASRPGAEGPSARRPSQMARQTVPAAGGSGGRAESPRRVTET